jgi:uncharacterized membrane-anchored protein
MSLRSGAQTFVSFLWHHPTDRSFGEDRSAAERFGAIAAPNASSVRGVALAELPVARRTRRGALENPDPTRSQ